MGNTSDFLKVGSRVNDTWGEFAIVVGIDENAESGLGGAKWG